MDVTKPISRRSLLQAAAATGAGAAAASLLPASALAAHSPEAADQVTLQFWTNHDAVTDVPLFKQVIQNFQAAYPNIKVNLTNYAAATYDSALIPTRAAGGTLADVFYNRTFATADRANRGWTLALDPYMASNHVNTSDFWPAEVAQMVWKGKQYSLPYDWSDFGVFYNKTMFDKKGIKYPPQDGNWTWDEMLTMAKEFVTTSGVRQTTWGVDISPVGWGWPTVGYVLAWGGKWVSPDLRSFMINTPEAVALFQTMQDAVYVTKAAPRSGAFAAGFDPWSSGQLAMSVNGSWATLQLRSTIGKRFDYDVVPLPKGPTGRRPLSPAGGAWSIASTSKHPAEAFAFVNFLTSTRSDQILISEPTRSVPGRKSAVPLWVSTAKSGKLPPAHVSVFPDTINESFTVPTVPYYNELATLTANAVTAILGSKADVKATLAKWQSDGQAAIKKYSF